jgi:hypothetical protein
MKLSDIVSDGTSKVLDMGYIPTREDCVRIIRENALAPDSLLRNLDILIKAFGLTVTYYELQGYFEESRLL